MIGTLALPRLVVESDGRALDDGLAATLASVVVDAALSAPAQCELTFIDPPQDPGAAPAPGDSLRVRLAGTDRHLFAGEVSAVEVACDPSGGRELRVRGYDALQRLRRAQRARVYRDVDAAGLAVRLAADAGLTVGPSPAGPRFPLLVQHRQSDLEVLLGVCERSGLFVTVEGEVLGLVALDGAGEPIELTLGTSLLEASVEVNADRGVRVVGARGWDLGRVEAHGAEAAEARSARPAAASAALDPVLAGSRRDLFDEMTAHDEMARGLAQAELDRRVATEVVLRAVALGDARLRPGAIVEIGEGVGRLAGRFVLTHVRQTIDRAHGHLAELSSEPPEPRPRARGSVSTVGVVRRVGDPEGLGRVDVALPSFGDVETGWIPVVSTGAGPGKGIVALPDPGDLVLVLLPGEEASQAVVLGGVFGPQPPFDDGVVGGETVRYGVRTKGGHVLRLDDGARLVRLEDSGGDVVELAPDAVAVRSESRLTLDATTSMDVKSGGALRIDSAATVAIASGDDLEIHSAGDLVIEAPGRTVRIRAAAIEFETA